jgi:hypothetical protein
MFSPVILKLTRLKSKIYLNLHLQRFNIRPLRSRFTAFLPSTGNGTLFLRAVSQTVGSRMLRSVNNKNKLLGT